jgi:hypothetical protein
VSTASHGRYLGVHAIGPPQPLSVSSCFAKSLPVHLLYSATYRPRPPATVLDL